MSTTIEREKKIATTFRLTPTAKRLLTQVAFRGGTTKTAILEAVIRQLAQEQGLWS